MGRKYFLANELSFKVDCKISFINKFFSVKYFTVNKHMKKILRIYFLQTNMGKYKKYFLVKYFTQKQTYPKFQFD